MIDGAASIWGRPEFAVRPDGELVYVGSHRTFPLTERITRAIYKRRLAIWTAATGLVR